MVQKKSIEAVNDRPQAGRSYYAFPFWFAASRYYLLSILASAVIYLVISYLGKDSLGEFPFLVAGITAVSFFVVSILVRELILRPLNRKALLERRFGLLKPEIPSRKVRANHNRKLSIEKNNSLISDIRRKSEAAKVLGDVADAHKEVFEYCEGYLSLASDQLIKVRPGSPRISAIVSGIGTASRRHRFHMLKWAELEAKNFELIPSEDEPSSVRIAAAERTLQVIERAIKTYSNEVMLAESRDVLRHFLLISKAASIMRTAEQFKNTGKREEAAETYSKFLIELDQHPGNNVQLDSLVNKIRMQIENMEGFKTH